MDAFGNRNKLQQLNLELLFIHFFRHHGQHRNDRSRNGWSNSCLGYVLKGNAEFKAGNTDIVLGPGSVIYIPKGQCYISEWRGKPTAEFYSLNFEFKGASIGGDPFAFQAYQDRQGALRHHFEKIQKALASEKMVWALSEFYQLYASLGQKLTRSADPMNRSVVAPAIRYLDEHFIEEFSIGQLAGLCQLGESQFYAEFKKNTGLTPVEYKNRCRIRRAVQLLASRDNNIERISDQLNFSSPSYFRRVLKQVTGLKPKEVQRQASEQSL